MFWFLKINNGILLKKCSNVFKPIINLKILHVSNQNKIKNITHKQNNSSVSLITSDFIQFVHLFLFTQFINKNKKLSAALKAITKKMIYLAKNVNNNAKNVMMQIIVKVVKMDMK